METSGIAEDADDLKKNQICPFPLTFCHLLLQGLLGTNLPSCLHYTLTTCLCRLTIALKTTSTNELLLSINILHLSVVFAIDNTAPSWLIPWLHLTLLSLSLLLAKMQDLSSLSSSLMADFSGMSAHSNNVIQKKNCNSWGKKKKLHLNWNKNINYHLDLLAVIASDTCNIFTVSVLFITLYKVTATVPFLFQNFYFLILTLTSLLLSTDSYRFVWLLPLKLQKLKYILKLISLF